MLNSYPNLTARVQREQAFPEFIGSTVAVGRGQQRAYRQHASSPLLTARTIMHDGLARPRGWMTECHTLSLAGARGGFRRKDKMRTTHKEPGEMTGPYKPTPRMLKKKGIAQKLNISIATLRRRWPKLKIRGFPQPDPDIGTTDEHAVDQWLDRQGDISEALSDAPKTIPDDPLLAAFDDKRN